MLCRCGSKDDVLIDYLLGSLRGKDRDSLEERYFRDDDQFEYLLAMEDDLIDRYLRGELSSRERRRFESHYLASPRRRERVQSARALMQAVAPAAIVNLRPANSRDPRWRVLAWSLGCATAVLLIGVSWLSWRNIGFQNQLALTRLQLQQRQRDLQENSFGRSAPLALSFILAPVQRGVDNPNRLIIPPEVQILNFSVDAPAAPQSADYRSMFRTPEGDQVGTSTDVTTTPSENGISAVITIPAAVFSPGTYILTLQASRHASGFQDVKSYSFTVARR